MTEEPHRRSRSRSWTGALSGAIASVPLMALLYLGHRSFGAPFPPYSLFELLARLLPGEVVTRGIEAMVAVLRRARVEDTARAAKWVEAGAGLALYLLLCAIVGSLLFVALYRVRIVRFRAVALAVFAFLLAAFGLLPSWLAGDRSAAGAIWNLFCASAWAAGLGFVQSRLHTPHVGEGWATVSVRGRRQILLRLAGASAVITLVGVALSRRARPSGGGIGGAGPEGEPWSATHPLPNEGAAVKPVPGTRPELTPVKDHYRVDINILPPRVDAERWRLHVGGLVRQPRAYTLEELRALPAMDQFITLSCISNPVAGDLIGTTRWTGVSFARLLDEVGLRPEATHVRMSAADGFDEVVSVEEVRRDPRVMLAWAWDGLPLTPEHGFPLRVYLPDRYGMKQPKWIERLEAISQWEPGYWVRRGWDREAFVKATSVIDVIGPEAVRDADGRTVVPVGGIAYAGTRGIRRVEIRVDESAWHPAALREPLSDRTWVLWRYEWPFEPGEHRFEVRCIDGRGQLQIAEPARPHPSGASGIHSRTFTPS